MSNCTYFDKKTTVQGELTTVDLVIEGAFKGKIKAKEKVFLKQSARIQANIEARKLMIEEGAIFDGNISLRNGGNESGS